MKNLLVFVIIILLACSCEKDSLKQLPPATQEGKNTFGCLVNGEVFVADRGGLFSSTVGVEFLEPDFFRASGSGTFKECDDDYISNVYFYIDNNINIEESEVIYFTENFLQSAKIKTCLGVFDTYGEASGELRITKLDTLNEIIAGTFWFDAKSEEGTVVEVREGRFDINYIPTR